MKQYIKNIISMALIVGLFISCNKEDVDVEKAMHIVVNGYNDGPNALQMSIDSTQYGISVAYGKYIIKPTSMIAQNVAYTYRSDRKRILTLIDTITKKVVYSRELPINNPKGLFNYIFLNGKELEIPSMASDQASNKLGFYIHYTTNSEPFDVFLYRKNNSTGQEFREYIVKNATPGKWIYVDYTANANFGTRTFLSSSSVCFTRTGTTNEWAFDNDQTKSQFDANAFFLPTTDEKGLIQPYFIKPMPYNQGLAKLFFFPDRQ